MADVLTQPAKVQKTEAPAAAPQEKPKCFGDLSSSIDIVKSSVLNASNPQDLKAILCGPGEGEPITAVLKSDCDEQLLFGIAFNSPVRLQSIGFAAPSAAPATVKLFVNRQDMGFDDVENVTPTQTLTLSGASPHLSQQMLQFVKFQNVNYITVFVENNRDDDEVSLVQRVSFVGDTLHKTNMDDLKKGG